MARRCELTDKKVQFGNNVSHAENKTRRRFNVNIRSVTLRSELMDRNVRLRIAASTLRTIDHNGGLDSFLLSSNSNTLSEEGQKLKRQLQKVKKTQA